MRWVQGASDDAVRDLVNASSAFLSIGVEGYGIPVLEAIRLGTPVLFDGIQPAADLMAGLGARRVPATSHAELVALFDAYSQPGTLRDAAGGVHPEAVPTWTAFSGAVADAVVAA